MPAIKEVEVETTLTPEPVNKEVPKCDVTDKKEEETSKEASKSEDVVESTDTNVPKEQKPQETEVTSSAADSKEVSSVEANGAAVGATEPKSEKQEDVEIAKTETVDSTANGNKVANDVEEAPKSAEADATVIATSDEPVKDGKETTSEVSTSEEKTSISRDEDGVAKDNDTSSSVTDTVGKADDAEVKEETKPLNGSQTKESQDPETSTPVEQMETTSEEVNKETTASPTVECTQESNTTKEVESEALAKVEPLTTDNEKMELSQSTSSNDVSSKNETNAKPTNSTVTGSDEVTQAVDGNAQEDTPKKEENTSADSTSEKEPTEAPESSGTSSTSETQPDVQNKIDELKKQGLAFFIQKNFCAAADSFGKLLEVQAPLYGEMSEKLAETYFLYGSAMYEYGKTENTVLGEKVPQKDEEEDDDEEEDTEEGAEEKMEEGAEEKVEEVAEDKMEVEETPAVNGKDEKLEEPSKELESSSDKKQPADESLAEEDKEDDEAFRVAWEMLELAKATFEKGNNKKRLADTFMKLGELGIETGNPEAISEMVKGLNVRKELYKDNNRIIPETHFTIGVAYAFFEKYDEAVEHFKDAKKCLEDRIEALSKSEGKDDLEEVDEMKKILPEIQDKIQDTLESKADHEKLKEKQAEEIANPEVAPFPASSDSKPVSNITHLVKRKRNVDDILPERAAKQIRQEESKDESKVVPTISESEAAATEKKPVASEVQPVASGEKPVASEEQSVATEEKPVASEEKPVAPEEKPVAPEEKPVPSEEKPVPSEEKPVPSEEKALVPEDKPIASEDKAVESEAKPTDEPKPTEKSEETKPDVEAKADEKAETAADKTEAASQGLSVEEEKMEVS